MRKKYEKPDFDNGNQAAGYSPGPRISSFERTASTVNGVPSYTCPGSTNRHQCSGAFTSAYIESAVFIHKNMQFIKNKRK